MLAAIGVESWKLFDRQIPPAVRLERALALPEGLGDRRCDTCVRSPSATLGTSR
jgi:hypothetical protein